LSLDLRLKEKQLLIREGKEHRQEAPRQRKITGKAMGKEDKNSGTR
jgi:hypothetical protein